MRKKNKPSLKLAFIFSLNVFLVMTLTMTAMSALTIILISIGWFPFQGKFLLVLYFAITSVIIGTVISAFIGKKAFNSIYGVTEATKSISKGDFNVYLDENIRIDEIRTMAKNFNIMTKELSNMEIFRHDFINNVSHEFKTPISAIEGYATLLQNQSLTEEKRSFYVDKIIYNTRRLSKLTGNILQLSRLENQNIDTEKFIFSLDEQIREIILLFENEWTEKNIQLDVDLDDTDYFGNSELLGQVWQNLIGNAIKFSKQNGNIRVLLKNNLDGIKVTISDDGIGMDEETQKRVFEKFYQGESSHATEGNGLGLTLVKKIIDLHNGKISVASKQNLGSSFTVIL